MIQVCLSEKISTIFNYKFTKMLEKIIAFSLKNRRIQKPNATNDKFYLC